MYIIRIHGRICILKPLRLSFHKWIELNESVITVRVFGVNKKEIFSDKRVVTFYKQKLTVSSGLNCK